MEKNFTTKQGLRQIDSLGVNMLKRNVLFFCFITVLGLIYIANTHYAEAKIRKIAMQKNELKELNWKYMTMKSELLQESAYSQIQEKLSEKDLALRGKSPIRVILKDN